MRLVSIVAFVSVLLIVLSQYMNSNNDDKVNSQLKSTNVSLETENGIQPVGDSAVLPSLMKDVPSSIVEPIKIIEEDHVETTGFDCKSYIKIGEKKNCLAQYTDEENGIDDTDINQYEYIDENGIAEVLPANMPPPSETVEDVMDLDEEVQKLLGHVQ